MTLEEANELITMRSDLSSDYNRNTARAVLREVGHGQVTVYKLIRDYGLELQRGIIPGTKFSSPFFKQVTN